VRCLRVVPLAIAMATLASVVLASPAVASAAFVQTLGEVSVRGMSATITTTGAVAADFSGLVATNTLDQTGQDSASCLAKDRSAQICRSLGV
jgi:hypothetical protein